MNASMQLLETENQCIKAQTIKVATGHISFIHTHTHTHTHIYIYISNAVIAPMQYSINNTYYFTIITVRSKKRQLHSL
jgi:hypothetical protein